jgi:hypothetical protein
METMQEERRRISFHFHPYHFDQSEHAVEKSDESGRRRYLKGIASGPRVDAHGERMTTLAIDSFMEQANSGDILLYADLHGIRFTDDIGILSSAEVSKDGDWITEYRLYDEQDGVDQLSVERAGKLWKQCNGLPPYQHPRQKGFSIEGYIPEEKGAVHHDARGRQMINMVELDGVVVVPRPAYQDSIAHAIYKALGETAPWQDDSTIISRIKTRIQEADERESFYRQRYQLDEAMETLVREAMLLPDSEQRDRLEEIFNEYKALMINLIVSNPSAFSPDEIRLDASASETSVTKNNILKGLISNLENLEMTRKEA